MARLRHVRRNGQQEPYDLRAIEIGGTYRAANGRTFLIARRSHNGKLLVGVTENGGWGFFREDGTAADGSGNHLHWYAPSGPSGQQRFWYWRSQEAG